MSRVIRGLLPLVLVLAGLGALARSGAASASYGPRDGHVLGVASTRLRHHTLTQVLSWLRHQPAVRSALRGADGRTLDIRFRDGLHAAILPRTLGTVRVPLARQQAPAFSRDQVPAAQGQALVLEPFATQLGLGPNAGDTEVQDLQTAGYQVNQLYDTAVSVASMVSLSHYNVVYMQTHAGVLAGGGLGVVTTGEPANGDPAVAPFLRNGSVIEVGISGSSKTYYAITSTFIHNYEGPFPAHSILFFNGCDLLSSSEFWNVLAAKGAGVMVSWTAEATSTDNFIAGVELFKFLDTPGTSVDSAISDVRGAGYGTSLVNGHTATLGDLGDGTITLQSAANTAVSTPVPGATATLPTVAPQPTGSGPTATPVVVVLRTPIPATNTPMATNTPAATSTPTATLAPGATPPTATATIAAAPTATATTAVAPTATPTSAPVHALTFNLKQQVAPGSWQHITMHTSPNTVVHIRVNYPNGDHQSAKRKTDKYGKAVYAYKQGASKIARGKTIAMAATVTMTTGAGAKASKSYRIRFGHLDVSVQPRAQWPGRKVTIWVHTAGHTPVALTLLFPNRTYTLMYRKTGRAGWAEVTYPVAKNKIVGKNHTVQVVARTKSKAPNYSTKTILSIR